MPRSKEALCNTRTVGDWKQESKGLPRLHVTSLIFYKDDGGEVLPSGQRALCSSQVD